MRSVVEGFVVLNERALVGVVLWFSFSCLGVWGRWLVVFNLW